LHMLFATAAIVLFATAIPSGWAQTCPETWKCISTTSPPTLDADVSDWASVEGITTSLVSITGETYPGGDASYKCMYDNDLIYFALEIPGDYRFDPNDNHLCASIATMTKIGASASFINMGGCPDALSGCDTGVPDTCADYVVDIGAHWELSTTEQNVAYPINVADSGQAGTGDDGVANKDDEYGVSPECRFDDDDANAGNEWAGAWAHTNPTEGASGTYIFELSRSLKTPSSVTDAQLTPGESYSFGVAFWDPFEIQATGWNGAGHYVTGCGTNWIELELVSPEKPPDNSTSAASLYYTVLGPVLVSLGTIVATFFV